MRPSNNLESKIPSVTYWRVQLLYVKVQVHSSLEPSLVYNQEQDVVGKSGSVMTFLTKFNF